MSRSFPTGSSGGRSDPGGDDGRGDRPGPASSSHGRASSGSHHRYAGQEMETGGVGRRDGWMKWKMKLGFLQQSLPRKNSHECYCHPQRRSSAGFDHDH